MFKDTITLFCRKAEREGDSFYPTVIRNVNLSLDHGYILKEYGAESQDKALLSLRFRKENDSVIIGDKPWLPPKEWDASENPGESLTLKGGTDFDFFWLGEWEGAEVIDSSQYDGGFFDYMNRTYDNVFAVSSVSGPFYLIPHFEVTGR